MMKPSLHELLDQAPGSWQVDARPNQIQIKSSSGLSKALVLLSSLWLVIVMMNQYGDSWGPHAPWIIIGWMLLMYMLVFATIWGMARRSGVRVCDLGKVLIDDQHLSFPEASASLWRFPERQRVPLASIERLEPSENRIIVHTHEGSAELHLPGQSAEAMTWLAWVVHGAARECPQSSIEDVPRCFKVLLSQPTPLTRRR